MPEPTMGEMARWTFYQRFIAGRTKDIDPRHVEAWMRLEHPVLDGLSRTEFTEAMYAALRTTLEQAEHDDVKERAIRNLGHFKDQQSVPLLIKNLEKPGIVRRAAALALAEIGLPAAAPAKPSVSDTILAVKVKTLEGKVAEKDKEIDSLKKEVEKLQKALEDSAGGAMGAIGGMSEGAVSELEFDFDAYAAEHFERMERTVAEPGFRAALG